MNRRLPASLRTRDDDPLAVFMRGATVGAFVGAVIAGSTIWRRARQGTARVPAGAPSRPGRERPGGEKPVSDPR